jgi:hypothetical protein
MILLGVHQLRPSSSMMANNGSSWLLKVFESASKSRLVSVQKSSREIRYHLLKFQREFPSVMLSGKLATAESLPALQGPARSW